ncbi:MAG: phytanoyl-CoA dioxygenase family protein [Bacteroidia bacterium]|nr:phytanoyl-CoA dioxygenase family protein [Bacteroidia bacterium]
MQLFHDNLLNEAFQKQGFVKIPLLNSSQVEKLLHFYSNQIESHQQQQTNRGFLTTSNTFNKELVQKVDQFNKSILLPELNKYLCNATFTISNFLVKEPNPESVVPPHQDWLLVDESQFTSFNVWICLHPANSNSGQLRLIPGSHLLNQSHRLSGQTAYFNDFISELEPYFVEQPTLPGECLIFHHSIIHASSENKSGKPRVACVIGGFSKDAKLYFFQPDPSRTNGLLRFSIQPETFLQMGINYDPPQSCYPPEQIHGIFEHWTLDQFLRKLHQKFPETPVSFWTKFRNWLAGYSN